MPILDKPGHEDYTYSSGLKRERAVTMSAALRPANHGRVKTFERRMRIERQQAHRMLEMALIKEYERRWGPVPYDVAAFAFVHATMTVAGTLVVEVQV